MPKEDDFNALIKRLEEAGIIQRRSDLSDAAIAVLKKLSKDEIECLFSVRPKFSEEGREKYDHHIIYWGF